MGYAFLGHGGLELAEGGYPEGMGVVAIDAGTTLQVYTDTGQELGMSKGDYEIFSKLQAPWPAMDSTKVTYNLELTFNEDDDKREKREPGFFARCLAPHAVIRAGADGIESPLLLCNGTPQTCPTDPRMITGHVPGPTSHTCDGILGKYKGELLWLACTVVYTDDEDVDEVVDAARGEAPGMVKIGYDPDDPAATFYYFEQNEPQTLDGWYDDQNDTVKDALRADPHIAEWEQNR